MEATALRSLVDATELVRLRWVAVAAQLGAISLAMVTGQQGPWWVLFAFVAIGAASNLVLILGRRSAGRAALAGLIFLDTLLLTAMLGLTGGAVSPFAPFFLVFPVLAALFLTPGLAWGSYFFILACYGSLFFIGDPGPWGTGLFDPATRTHTLGTYATVAVSSPFLVATILRTRRALTIADRELATARNVEARNTRLASLATLAAGAAHEFATPLGTIAVASSELARVTREKHPELHADVRLIQVEVGRCRQVLDELSADVGAGAGERSRTITIGDLVDLIVHDRPSVEVEIPEELEERTVLLPPRMVAQAARRLVGNALDATNGQGQVRLCVLADDDHLSLRVDDEGPGMPADVLAHAGEPFFTTKAPGRGRGLGLWFVRAVAQHLGGELNLESRSGQGTHATLRVPCRAPALPQPPPPER